MSTRASELVALREQLAEAGYIAEAPLAAALLLMQDLGRPLLLEGDAVAEQVLGQFAANFSAELRAQAAPATPAGAAAPIADDVQPEKALNGFALLRAMVRSWLQALFGWRGA